MATDILTIYTDGGARGNPGPAGIGVALYDTDRQLIATVKEYIGEATNNQAEYRAVIAGLTKARALGAQEVHCFLDSELVVRQLTGEYKVKDKGLGSLFVQVWNLQGSFKRVTYQHVFREDNRLADALVNEAIDAATGR